MLRTKRTERRKKAEGRFKKSTEAKAIPIRETDQKQTRSSTPGQTKKMTNVLRNVIAIAILAISGKGGVVDSAGPLRRGERRVARISQKLTASSRNKEIILQPPLAWRIARIFRRLD